MDILALSELLQPPSTSSSSSHQATSISNTVTSSTVPNQKLYTEILTPASFGSHSNTQPTTTINNHDKKKNDDDDDDDDAIWKADEIPHIDAIHHHTSSSLVNNDTRVEPQHEIYYKQAVGTEDVYLGISGKSPASFDCTHVVVKIYLPGCQMKDLDLDVKKNHILLESDE